MFKTTKTIRSFVKSVRKSVDTATDQARKMMDEGLADLESVSKDLDSMSEDLDQDFEVYGEPTIKEIQTLFFMDRVVFDRTVNKALTDGWKILETHVSGDGPRFTAIMYKDNERSK